VDPAPPAVDPGSIFRQEALEHRARHRGPGDIVRAAPSWTRSAYWALLALMAVGVVASVIVRVDRFAGGPVVVRGGVARAVVPAGAGVKVGAALALQITGRPRVALVVDAVGSETVDAEQATRALGLAGAPSGANLGSGRFVVVTAKVPAGSLDGLRGNASIRAGSEPFIVTLVPVLRSWFGGSGG